MDPQTEAVTQIRRFLDSFEAAQPRLARMGFSDPAAAHRNFLAIAERGVPLDLLAYFAGELEQSLPGSADPDMAFNNFERMLAKVRSPLSIMTFLHRKPNSLVILLQMFATSQFFSDLIISSPEYFDFLWEQGEVALDPKLLREDILGELKVVWENEELVLHLLRRHRQREMLRIGFRDIVLGEPLDRITRSLSDLADCLVEVALAVAYRRQAERHGEPRGADSRLARIVVLAMGKLGGAELNYSSDIDLMLIYDLDGRTDGRRKVDNAEFFSLVIRDMVRLLSANTSKGACYRVDLRLRPHGHTAALCMSLDQTLAYYDQHGRTWERQALVKARPIAGSMRLGDEFLRAIEPFVYRRFLSHVEINEIKTIKRKIESKATSDGDTTNLKTGPGGIRDIEFVTQFLQLVNGGVMGEIRERNSLKALKKLAAAGCINPDEHHSLEMAYRFLRKAEHRLQFMFDLQTHRIPTAREELDKLALRLGYLAGGAQHPGADFLADLETIMARNQRMLRHLMLDLFPDRKSGEEHGEPETDLILDPDPDAERVENVLRRYRFRQAGEAYRNLTLLAREEVPFLSSVRCRHFLANIAPPLLRTIAEAPDPDMALVNLEKVSASLGAKGVLWECFSFNPPFLRLYVNLCSWSQFLTEILVTNPGMIDELLDSLIMNQPLTREELLPEIKELLRGACEIEPILFGFKNTHLLEIGVGDILGKTNLRETTTQLSDLAESIIAAVSDWHFDRLVLEHGMPTWEDDPGRPSWYAILGLGKFGGRELSYHSDLDVVLIYERDGKSRPANGHQPSKGSLFNHHFYTELAQRIVKTISRMTALGRLYSIDFRLRPTGRSGALVLPLDKFESYYRDASALWERLALTRSRVVQGNSTFAQTIEAATRRAATSAPFTSAVVDEALAMRRRLEESRPANDVKRGPGGIVDIEFAIQLMQLCYGALHPEILWPNVWECLERIERTELWDAATCQVFSENYGFFRAVESRLRIVYNVARDDVPEEAAERQKLALRLGYEGDNAGAELVAELGERCRRTREQFLACTRKLSG